MDYERRIVDRHASMHFVVPLRSSIVPSTFISCRGVRQPHDAFYRYSVFPIYVTQIIACIFVTFSRNDVGSADLSSRLLFPADLHTAVQCLTFLRTFSDFAAVASRRAPQQDLMHAPESRIPLASAQ